jgi:hypothetical protein
VAKFLCVKCGKAWEENRLTKDGVTCDECREERDNQLTDDGKAYIGEMDCWIKEQKERKHPQFLTRHLARFSNKMNSNWSGI